MIDGIFHECGCVMCVGLVNRIQEHIDAKKMNMMDGERKHLYGQIAAWGIENRVQISDAVYATLAKYYRVKGSIT